VDSRNSADFIPFVEFCIVQGWFNGKFRATLQPARVAAYSEKSRFVERIGLPDEDFDQLKQDASSLLPPETIEEPESPSGYAAPKTSVCAALSNNAIVIGADRRLYRCGLQVSEEQRAVGSLNHDPFRIINNEPATADKDWWAEFDPTTLRTCSVCSFLPVCLGGCPKKQLEADTNALEAQSMYWRKHLPRLIYKTANVPERPWQFAERDQFRLTLVTCPSGSAQEQV
jgi:uncharacterized protein